MNWLTKEEIKKAAETSDIAAVECSLIHWKQMQEATPKEFAEARSHDLVDWGSGFCACCKRFLEPLISVSSRCGNCPLQGKTGYADSCCQDLWRKARDSITSHKSPEDVTNIVHFIETVYNNMKAKLDPVVKLQTDVSDLQNRVRNLENTTYEETYKFLTGKISYSSNLPLPEKKPRYTWKIGDTVKIKWNDGVHSYKLIEFDYRAFLLDEIDNRVFRPDALVSVSANKIITHLPVSSVDQVIMPDGACLDSSYGIDCGGNPSQ